MRSRSRSINSNARSQQSSPFPPPSGGDEHHRICAENYHSKNTSASNSGYPSTSSIFSLPFTSPHHSRHSTPPTPISSPSLYRPPSLVIPPDGTSDSSQYPLHPSQYRQAAQVRETHNLDVDYDPVSGRKTINHYSIIEEIGRGTHGKVKLGFDMNTNEMVAIKIVERSSGRPRLGRKGDGENSETKVRREIAILKKIRHDNVVRLIEVIDDARYKKVYLVLEYVVRGEVIWRKDGDMDVIMRDRRRIRCEFAGDRLRLAKESQTGKSGDKIMKRRKSKRKDLSPYWSLEFASGFESAAEDDTRDDDLESTFDDFSDADSIYSICEEDRYIPAMEIEEARRCFRDTVVGLDHLHWNGIVHRDIKPANLLWSNDKTTKISDFGVSFLGRPIRDDDDEGTGEEDEPTGFEQNDLELAKTAGTPAFFAPELCSLDITKPRVPITSAIDVWALGVTLFCFIFGRLPFMADHEYTLFKCICEDELVIPRRRIRANKGTMHTRSDLSPDQLEEYETEPVDDDLRDLIKRLLTKNPQKRILLKEVKRHPWVLEGLRDPIGWVERTDPESASEGKVEITTEDVETAVSVPGIITRAKSAIRKATGSWVRGLRKRGSSTASNKDSKEVKETREGQSAIGLDGAGESSQKQGQLNFHRYHGPERELQWMGSIVECRDDEMLNALAPSMSNSSGGSTETVLGTPIDHQYRNEIPDPHTIECSPRTGRAVDQHRLRRTQPMNLVGGSVLRRHSSQSSDIARTIRETHRAPTVPPPTTPTFEPGANVFKSESTAALAAPSIIRRMVRSTRSEDTGLFGYKRRGSCDDHGPYGAREVLTEALNTGERPQETTWKLPSNTPEPRSVYTMHDSIENGAMLNVSPRSYGSEVRQKMQQQQREEQELARATLGKNIIDLMDQSTPPSPEGLGPTDTVVSQENRRHMLEENEGQLGLAPLQHGSPTMRTPTGWAHDSLYFPTPEYVTPPITMALSARNKNYFDLHTRPASPKLARNLVSSSSDERFNTTAGSSLTNSASFPSVLTNPSSVSSDFFTNTFSRKGSFVPGMQAQEASMDEDARIREMRLGSQSRRGSEFIFPPDQDEDEESDSSSEGGIVMKSPISKRSPHLQRTRSIAVGQLARTSNEEKDRELSRNRARSLCNSGRKSYGEQSTPEHGHEQAN